MGDIGRTEYIPVSYTHLDVYKRQAFRGIRANLRFLHKEDKKSKVILLTSSVGGEGKTYISMNIASVLGLSGKKTILLGMDYVNLKFLVTSRLTTNMESRIT